jgi:hypothetical protein
VLELLRHPPNHREPWHLECGLPRIRWGLRPKRTFNFPGHDSTQPQLSRNSPATVPLPAAPSSLAGLVQPSRYYSIDPTNWSP